MMASGGKSGRAVGVTADEASDALDAPDAVRPKRKANSINFMLSAISPDFSFGWDLLL